MTQNVDLTLLLVYIRTAWARPAQVYPRMTFNPIFHCSHERISFTPSTSNFNYHCTNYIKSLTSSSDTAETSKTNCLSKGLCSGKKVFNRNTTPHIQPFSTAQIMC